MTLIWGLVVGGPYSANWWSIFGNRLSVVGNLTILIICLGLPLDGREGAELAPQLLLLRCVPITEINQPHSGRGDASPGPPMRGRS